MTQQYVVEQYIFNKTAKTITFPNITAPSIEGFQLVTNLTTGDIIYQFNSAAKGGTVSGNVLTLDHDTSAMANSDKLQILYNPPVGGFFDRALVLLWQAVEYLRSPSYMTRLAAGDMLRVLSDSNSNINNVVSVTTTAAVTNLTNLNTIDSRELIWSMWDAEYNTGIRNKIV